MLDSEPFVCLRVGKFDDPYLFKSLIISNIDDKIPMSVFRFKKFNVVNERSAMKVNTDGVLLGAVMTIRPSDRRLLDIGTGTGTIALMAAQRVMGIPDQVDRVKVGDDRVKVEDDGVKVGDDRVMVEDDVPGGVVIDAIDIDEPSATEAAANFGNSPWAAALKAHLASLEDFAVGMHSQPGYDLIFSNPPYFDNALQAPEERRNAARHTSTGLSYREILDFASVHLTEQGRVALVLPADTERELTRHARMCGLHLYKITRIRTVPRKSPTRIIAEFSRQRTDSPEDIILTIQNEGQYTQEYLSLTKEFYLFA